MNSHREESLNEMSRELPSKAAALYNAVRRQGDVNAFGQLRKLADSGDAVAMYCLGKVYCYGYGVPEDVDQATRWFLRAAERGHTEAMYQLGEIYGCQLPIERNSRPEDSAQALIWWHRAAARRHRDALLRLGNRAFHWDAVALVLFRQLAERGNADAQRCLGWMYHSGRGVPRDLEQAAFWYCRAAEQGEESAVNGLFHLAKLCKAAFACLRQAAERGHAEAQFCLGEIYYYYGAPDMPEDMEQAEFWYRRAAEQGHKLALDTLSRSG